MNEPTSSRLGSDSGFTLEGLTTPAFTITHELSGTGILVRLRGNADSDVAQAFEHYLLRLHDQAMRLKLREVVMDFRELYFLTSSCIKSLGVAIKRLVAEDARSQYHIRFVTTPTLRWQERSFEVLCQLAPLLVSTSPD